MQLKNFNTYFFLVLLFFVTLAALTLFMPFFTAILAAAIIAIMFHGIYDFLCKVTRQSTILSATLTCFFTLIVIVAPLFLMFGIVAGEANTFYKTTLVNGSLETQLQKFEGVLQKSFIAHFVDTSVFFSEEYISENMKKVSQNIIMIIQKTYQGIAGFLIWIFVFFFTLFYFLLDGKQMVKKIMYLSPLPEKHEKMIIEKFISITRAILKGTIIIGFIQGSIGWLMFFLLGVPSSAVWGIIMIIMSIIPVIGAGIIWMPTGIIMLLTGKTISGIIILVVGFGVISTIDNILRPRLVGRDTQMHPLFIFFATLGGIIVFGLSGFMIGPIIIALTLALWEIYAKEFNIQIEEYNNN